MGIKAKGNARLSQESVSEVKATDKEPKAVQPVAKVAPKKSVKKADSDSPFGWLECDGLVKVTIVNHTRASAKNTIEVLKGQKRIDTYIPLEIGETSKNAFDTYIYMGVSLTYPKNTTVLMPQVINDDCKNRKYAIKTTADRLRVTPERENNLTR